ncbi:cellulase family glycosylhydrolase [Carboxylicivirga linearis]|uniref:Cellulase family glycosylhydrolase n=1 Tax=Carboxylicivirga linearis TaxID=1628157 RepID=A0ABS5JX30_9BACT|nr:cellulase family glycosylhydrolase [Carboxylicivirga linearis]MBS2099373.1 cellulase family glycosylhydrolase [Carboxylicivirga linearis]
MINLHWKMFVVLFTFIAFIACEEDSPRVTPELEVSVTELSFSNEGQQKAFKITSNVDWILECTESWCTVTPLSGSSGVEPVKVTAEANSTTDQRTAQLIITAGDLTETITISQDKNNLLVLEENEFTLTREAQELTIAFTRSDEVEITINNSWISLKELKSEIQDSKVFVIDANLAFLTRKGTITFTMGDIVETATIYQNGDDITIPADQTGVESTAIELAAKMIAGWNVGNSLEVPGGETNWNNPKVTKDVIDAVKAAGFNAVRIPCAWDGYIIDRETFEIDPAWLIRVKEVVDYCIDNDMYAIINTHWDGGWLENNPTYDKQEEVNEQLYAIWQQVGIYFRIYDEHLLFAGTNEVHVENVYTKPTNENIEVQQSFNQTFVNAVRSTGGKNAYRNLIVQTYNTNIGWGVELHNMPTDEVDGRLFVEVHYYDPYDFTLNNGDGLKTLWGEGYDNSYWGQEDYVQSTFASMKEEFYDKGIPIILGEYGAMYRSNLTGNELILHNESRNYFLKTVTGEAKASGMVPFIWDNGGDDFGLFNRYTAEQVNSGAIQAIIEGATN